VIIAVKERLKITNSTGLTSLRFIFAPPKMYRLFVIYRMYYKSKIYCHIDILYLFSTNTKVLYNCILSTIKENVKNAKVYKFIKPQDPLKEAVEIAEKLGIKGEVKKFENMNTYSIESDAGILNIGMIQENGNICLRMQEILPEEMFQMKRNV